jgi:hypothetical protein
MIIAHNCHIIPLVQKDVREDLVVDAIGLEQIIFLLRRLESWFLYCRDQPVLDGWHFVLCQVSLHLVTCKLTLYHSEAGGAGIQHVRQLRQKREREREREQVRQTHMVEREQGERERENETANNR